MSDNVKQAAVLWSGGKDSCFAYYKAILDGIEVSHLLNFTSKDGTRCHGLYSESTSVQSKAIGIPIIRREYAHGAYEETFKSTIEGLKQFGVNTGIFGDIDVQEHKDWIYRVCGELDIEPILPLWGLTKEQILADFIDSGFEAIVVSVKADVLGKEWLGRKIDAKFAKDVQRLHERVGVNICGESGEYHTFVTNGPIFKRKIRICRGDKVLKNGYWLLNI